MFSKLTLDVSEFTFPPGFQMHIVEQLEDVLLVLQKAEKSATKAKAKNLGRQTP